MPYTCTNDDRLGKSYDLRDTIDWRFVYLFFHFLLIRRKTTGTQIVCIVRLRNVEACAGKHDSTECFSRTRNDDIRRVPLFVPPPPAAPPVRAVPLGRRHSRSMGPGGAGGCGGGGGGRDDDDSLRDRCRRRSRPANRTRPRRHGMPRKRRVRVRPVVFCRFRGRGARFSPRKRCVRRTFTTREHDAPSDNRRDDGGDGDR